jgi:hypothetical protein
MNSGWRGRDRWSGRVARWDMPMVMTFTSFICLCSFHLHITSRTTVRQSQTKALLHESPCGPVGNAEYSALREMKFGMVRCAKPPWRPTCPRRDVQVHAVALWSAIDERRNRGDHEISDSLDVINDTACVTTRRGAHPFPLLPRRHDRYLHPACESRRHKIAYANSMS